MVKKFLGGRGLTAPALLLLFLALIAGCGEQNKDQAPSPAVQTEATKSSENADAAPGAASEGPLAGTEWRLVEFQSMDDSQGATRPQDPSRYTMKLNGDGSVSMKLDCNTAKGTWSSKPGADPTSGSFELGPLASTRILCPPPSMGEQIAMQAQYIRSYLLKDGRLYLSLMADGGIYAWEPNVDTHFITKPDPEIEAAILSASPYYTRDVVEAGDGAGGGRYVYGLVDLNGDGKDEVLVYTLGSFFCGTGGCSLLLFTEGTDGYTLVNNFPISRLPVIVLDEKTNGWNNIAKLESGGGAPATYVTYTYDGKKYVESGRVPADEVPRGESYLTGDLEFSKGIPLEPRE